MTGGIFWDALIEALYMGLFVLLFSNLWGNRIGAAFAARHCDPQKHMPASVPGRDCRRHVPDDEPCGFHTVQHHSWRSTGRTASRHLDRYSFKEFSDGLLLEYVRCSAVHTLALWEDLPGKISIVMEQDHYQILLHFHLQFTISVDISQLIHNQ